MQFNNIKEKNKSKILSFFSVEKEEPDCSNHQPETASNPEKIFFLQISPRALSLIYSHGQVYSATERSISAPTFSSRSQKQSYFVQLIGNFRYDLTVDGSEKTSRHGVQYRREPRLSRDLNPLT